MHLAVSSDIGSPQSIDERRKGGKVARAPARALTIECKDSWQRRKEFYAT